MGTKRFRSSMGLISALVTALLPAKAYAVEGEQHRADDKFVRPERASVGLTEKLIASGAIKRNRNTGDFAVDENALLRALRNDMRKQIDGAGVETPRAEYFENLFRRLKPGSFRSDKKTEGLRSLSFDKGV